MAKFKFRLATLLRLREADRDERRARLAEAYRAEEVIEAEQQRIANELVETEMRGRRVASPGSLNVDQLTEVRRFELVLRAQREHVAKQRQTLEAEVEQRRLALVDANRQVRVLEELRQKQLKRHHQEENRQEIKQMDEAGGLRSAREDDS